MGRADRPGYPVAGDPAVTTVAVLAALPLEYDAVVSRGNWTNEPDVPLGLLQLARRTDPSPVDLYAGCALGTGPQDAAGAAQALVSRVSPDLLFLVGICAGVRKDVGLGDICLSEQMVDYEPAKVTPEGILRRWEVFRAPSSLVAAARRHGAAWKPPVAGIKTHAGTILSGSKVVADGDFVDELRRSWPQAIGLEMESSGIARVVDRTNGPPFLMVKAVCDRADREKSDEWQPVAAALSADFVLTLLDDPRNQPFRDRHGGAVAPPLRLTATDAMITMLCGAFSLEELRVATVSIEVDWDELQGETKSGKAASLVTYVGRRKKRDLLRSYIERERPGLWESGSLGD